MKITGPMLFLLLASAAGAQNWPAFRGPNASGIGSGQPPATWDVTQGSNVRWKTPVPGLAHSSPVVWGDRVYVTTAVPLTDVEVELVPGDVEKGGIRAAKDQVRHSWRVYALERATGKVVWQRSLYEGVPRVKRHVKASHASATPATNGDSIVVLLGSEGLYCLDREGNLRWKQDLGVMNVGLVGEIEYEWGPASSPMIHENLVIVQNDRHKDSFLAAYELASGKPVWQATRDEWPSWATPVIVRGGGRTELVTSSPHFIRGYDPRTGKELWRLEDPKGEVKVPTPVVAGDVVIVTGGYPPGGRPIVAVRAGAKGDISLKDNQTSSKDVLWKLDRGSPYTGTPIVVDGILYVSTDNGILSAYDVKTGQRIYQQRLAAGGFSASPVYANGQLFFTSEDGDVYVVKAGREFQMLGTNSMHEVCMATPAIAGDTLFVRTRSHLYAIAAQ